MNSLHKIKRIFNESLTLSLLLKVLAVVLIVYIISLSSPIWSKLVTKLSIVITPFVIGFGVAYIVHPIVEYLEKHHIHRKISIPVIILIVVFSVAWLIFTVFPTVYNDLIHFLTTVSDSIKQLSLWYVEASDNPSMIFVSIAKEAINLLNDYKTWLPSIANLIPSFINNVFSILTNLIFSMIITIYVLFDYKRITKAIYTIGKMIHTDIPDYLSAIDAEVSVYIRALVVLMIIKFFEYSFLYYIIGHRDWIILGLLTSIGLLVPYFGATVANGIGILTALSLPMPNIFLLIVGICVFSTLDAYVMSPIVHAKRSKVEPLWTLFSVFCGGIFFGPIGIMIAVPAYMSIKEIIKIYQQKTLLQTK